ncbi:MAG: rhomboid family intramembrane serine protease [Planctomycetota bacterium]|jgi:membrane associated rhomboid family serine protease
MFIVVPYRTDAAIEHRPWGTFALIGANLAVAVLLGFPSDAGDGQVWIDSWVLRYGEFNPLTWVTNAFVHGGVFHLLLNMLFLWTFGLIVEGSIGWRRFLPVYLGIVIVQSAVEQILMLGADAGGSCGASAGVSGLMAVAAIWAPRGHVNIFLWILTIIRTAEVRILSFCVVWLGLDILVVLLSGFSMGSAMFHVMGAVMGLAIGVHMLKRGWVDCEGWDLFSLRAHGAPRRRHAAVHGVPRLAAPKAPDPNCALARALVDVREALEAGDAVGADDCCERAQRAAAGWVLPREDLQELVEALRRS